MWADFHFLRPAWLLLYLPALYFLWRILRYESAGLAWREVIAPHLLPHLLVGHEERSRWRPAVLLALVWSLGIAALAGPSLRRLPAPFAEERMAIAVVVECTETMETPDIQPTRLERAGQKVGDFLGQRPDVTAALFAYAGSAHRVMPFTEDANIIASFASELRHDLMPATGEALAEAIAMANAELQELARPGAILLMTDGLDPAQLERVRQAGTVPVHILAIGRALDEAALRRAASAMDGSWVRVTADASDVESLAGRIETNLQMAGDPNSDGDEEDGGARWADAGYSLVLFLLVPAAFWFRKGWTVSHG